MTSRPSTRAKLSAIASVVVPLAAYLVLHQALGNSTQALAITEAIPVLWLVAIGIAHRRIDPVALIAVVGFEIALAITAASGGSSLPLKLKRAAFPVAPVSHASSRSRCAGRCSQSSRQSAPTQDPEIRPRLTRGRLLPPFAAERPR